MHGETVKLKKKMKYRCVRLYCVIHKNSLLLNQHNGDDAPKKKIHFQVASSKFLAQTNSEIAYR